MFIIIPIVIGWIVGSTIGWASYRQRHYAPFNWRIYVFSSVYGRWAERQEQLHKTVTVTTEVTDQ